MNLDFVEPEDLSPREHAVLEMTRWVSRDVAEWTTDAILALGDCEEFPVPDVA